MLRLYFLWPQHINGQAACKPGSVHLPGCPGRIGDHSSGTILADRLTRPTRIERGVAPAAAEAAASIPIRSCSGRGLPCRPCRQVRGALLPHPFTLTPDKSGAVYFLWRFPSGFPGQELPVALTPWSPDFPPADCSASDRPAA